MAPYHIILADDHAMFRKGLKKIIEELPGLEVIGEIGDGLELLALLKEVTPHMVILDISMPHLRGIEAIHEIEATHPAVKILVLTMHREREYLYQAIAAGAEGYLLKDDADTELSSAIEAIRNGKTYVSPLLSDELREGWTRTFGGKLKLLYAKEPLTTREKEVLKLIAEGKSSKEIADLLDISVRTVERHRANITGKLDLRKTADLVKYAIQRGYV